MKTSIAVQLQPIVSELETSRGEQLLGSFSGFIEEAAKWEKEAKAIVVTDISQTDLIKNARTLRITLKNIRTNTENTRKQLKEQSLREGKAIDGMANNIISETEKL